MHTITGSQTDRTILTVEILYNYDATIIKGETDKPSRTYLKELYDLTGIICALLGVKYLV